MRIIQVAHALHPTDAASRQLLNMDKLLRGLGYETAMYAHRLDESLTGRVGMMGDFSAEPEDIAVFEDAYYAARTAKAAGFYVVGVYDPDSDRHWKDMQRICDETILSWEELL